MIWHFFEMVERACTRGAQLRSRLTRTTSIARAARLKELPGGAGQPSWASPRPPHACVRGEFDRVLDGVRNLREAACRSDQLLACASTCTDRRGGLTWVGSSAPTALHRPHLYTGNAVKAWRHLG
jgi:hypothetical protein